MEELIPYGGRLYWVFLAALLLSRGLDFLSTWIATPSLVLEANPIARRLGWRWGLAVNFVVCLVFAAWPLPAIVISTTSVLVAARNLQSAWLMRSLGEFNYQHWMADRLADSGRGVVVFCILAQALLVGGVGGVLVLFSEQSLVPFAIGSGIMTYATAVALFGLLSMWRLRRAAP